MGVLERLDQSYVDESLHWCDVILHRVLQESPTERPWIETNLSENLHTAVSLRSSSSVDEPCELVAAMVAGLHQDLWKAWPEVLHQRTF